MEGQKHKTCIRGFTPKLLSKNINRYSDIQPKKFEAIKLTSESKNVKLILYSFNGGMAK